MRGPVICPVSQCPGAVGQQVGMALGLERDEGDTPVVLQVEKHSAHMVSWLQEFNQGTEVALKGLGEKRWVPTGPGVGGLEKGGSGLRDSDPSLSQVLRQQIKSLEEALEEEEMW